MNIRPRSIPKFQGGNNIWYLGLIDYDPTKYLISYDTSRLVNGDMSDTILSPWKSNISGYDVGRYLPTNHGAFGKGKEHYNYTLGVEGLDYYKKFGEDLLDSNGNFTPTGEAWAKAVDALLPNGSNASFYDPKTGQLRTSWTTQYRDAHGRPAQTFTNLKDYVNHVRNDLLLGARHNVFLNKGKRYFYIDNLGLKHWVDPSVIDKYNVSKDPSEQGWEGTTYWDDYELTGLKDPSKTPGTDSSKTGGGIPVGEKADPESFWSKLGAGLKNVAPDLLDALRLAGNMHNNDRVYNESMKAIIPNLLQSYTTHRLIVGDEATKLAYYRRAAQGQTKAGQPFTSDADRLVAYMNEAKRIGDELRAQGDLADNLRIRETSAESSQHADANKERDTTIANLNITELNKASAAKHLLTAQKHSADWTNLELFIMGKQAKLELKKAKLEALNDLIWTLQSLNELENNQEYLALQKAAEDAWSNSKNPNTDPKVKEALLKLKNWKTLWLIQTLQSRPNYAKSGTKLIYKDNTDKYLYKTSRDIVEHFRKMSKMTDDSRVRTLPKAAKLTPHPKKAKKYLLGGVAPFTIYRPLGVGGESAVSTQTSSSASSDKKSDKEKDKLDMIKELFKSVQGLPIDVTKVYQDIMGTLNKAKAFGDELSSDDIASMYLNSMQKLSQLKYSLEAYKQAHALAVANDALNEVAVGTNGELILLDRETLEVKRGTLKQVQESDGKLNPLTNGLLLNMRAHSPNLVFDDDVFNVVNNGIGMTKIAAQIQSMAASLGSIELKLEGISEVLAKLVKAGLLILTGTDGTPDGLYKVTLDSKNSQAQVKAALNYIYNMLPTNYKTILAMHSGGPELSLALIASFLTSQTSPIMELSISPLTGKASKDSTGNGGKGDSENSAGLAFVLGQGPKELISFNTGTSNEIEVLGIKGVLLTKSNENLGLGSTLQDATKSLQGGYLLWNKATFGGSRLNPSAYNHIILNDSTILGVDLPYTKDVNGNEVPNFLMLRKMEQADDDIRQNNITDINLMNLIYIKYGLDPKYTSDGKLNLLKYKRFAAIQATLDELSLQNKEAILSDEVLLAGDIERDLYKELMKKSNKDYDLDNGIFGYFKDNLYKGTIFIPYSEDIAFAALSSGLPFKQDLPNNVTTIQEKLYAPKISQYVSPQATLSLVKNN